MKIKIIIVILTILAIASIIIYQNISMNFTILAGIYLVAVFLLYVIYNHDKGKGSLATDRVNISIGVLMLALVVMCTCKTLGNYFYGHNDVYSNSDHHAVRIDGVALSKAKDFVLAGNTKEAFFDNEYLHGTLRIVDYDENSVRLRSSEFSQAVYIETYEDKEKKSATIINEENLITLKADDRVQFIAQRDTCELSWNYFSKKQGWFKECFADPEINCAYVYTYKGVSDTLVENRVLKRGLDLNTLLGEVTNHHISFNGINLLRKTYFTKNIAAKDFVNQSFVLELNRAAYEQDKGHRIAEIRVIGSDNKAKSRWISASSKRKDKDVIISMGTPFSIGSLAGNTTVPVKFSYNNEKLCIEYITPQYHQLSSLNKNGANTIFITSTLSREIIENQNPPENIMLFDFFAHENNGNNFSSPLYLSYVSGPTTQEMRFLINRNIHLRSGEVIKGITSANGCLQWNMQVENLKETATHVNESHIILFIIVLGFILGLNLLKGPESNRGSVYTIIEMVAYMALLLFFSFRFLLMWRTAIFPPIEQATIYEFHHFFRNEEVIIYQFIGLNLFVMTIQSVKLIFNPISQSLSVNMVSNLLSLCFSLSILVVAEIYCFNITGYGKIALLILPILVYFLMLLFPLFFNIRKWVDKLMTRPWKFVCPVLIALIVLFAILAWAFHYAGGGQVTKILVPVCIYFLVEFLIWRFWPVTGDGTYKDIGRAEHFSFKDILTSGFGLSLLNGLAFSVALIKSDGGYGIMFLSFFMFVTVLKLYDFVRSYISYDADDQRNNKHLWHILCILGLAMMCAVFFFFYKNILGWMATNSFVVCSVVVAIILLVLLWVVAQFILGLGLFKTRNARLITIFLVIGISCGIIGAFKLMVFKDHTKQRVMVHVASPMEGLAGTQTPAEERRFFEASINDYILNVYNQQAAEIDAIGGKGRSYFKMQEHSKVGAMYGAQTSDILVARFIIAEHGQLLLLFFLLMYIFMLFLGIKMQVKYRVSKMLLIQIPALLFIHSLFVWLANTQMFIFLGQDFPLFSLHSKLAVLYYMVLTTVWVCIATLEKLLLLQEDSFHQTITYPNYYAKGGIFVTALLAILFLFYLVHSPRKGNYGDKRYRLEALLAKTDSIIQLYNDKFAQFQDSAKIKVSNLSDVSTIVKAFNLKYGPEIKQDLESKSPFHYRLWERFAEKGGAKSNKSSSLIHVRKKNGILQFAVKTNYFDRNLPTAEAHVWRGNVVASHDQNQRVKLRSANNEFTQYILPDSWVKSANKVVVLKHTNNRPATIINATENHTTFKFDRGYAVACCRFSEDNFYADGLENLAGNTYFARNVMINGRRSFIYPMSEKFFWAYTFANEMAKQKNDYARMLSVADKKLPVSFHDNVPITLEQELSADIYNLMGAAMNIHSDTYMSVVAADGYGRIRSMVDRKKRYMLNPNNTKELNRIVDELYMDFDSKQNDRYFGNMNLLTMADGPGSSQKPIVWTAVASGIDYNWKDLQIFKFKERIDGNEVNIGLGTAEGKYYYTRFFNGERLYDDERKPVKTFKALFGDENRGGGVGLRGYMRHSSNYYNALMLYMGSFSREDLNMKTATSKAPDKKAMFVALKKSDIFSSKGYVLKEKYEESFPILTQSQSNYDKLFKLNRKLSREPEASLLFHQLNAWFEFNGEDRFSSLYNNLDTHRKKRLSSYAFVVNPTFAYNLRDASYDREYLMNAIHQAAVGGGSPWQVSPLSMAQCFGRLTILKKNYRLTIDPRLGEETEYVGFPETSLSNGYLKARQEFLLGMNEVFSGAGTGRDVKAKSEKEGNQIRMKKGDYYIYGKTGTCNENGTGHSNLHRLGVVITDRPIESLELDKLKEVKFYTVYFTARYPYMTYYGLIIDKIIDSKGFREYMNEDNR